MCGGGNKTTTTSTQAPNPAAMGYYNQAFGTASNVANTPTSAVPLQGVANLSSEQNAGIGGINQYANAAQPYFQQAATYANNAATPITQQQIQDYQNPYTQQVVNATQGQFNLMNQQALENIKGNAAAQGALGGDRAGSVAPSAYYGAVLPGQEQQIAGLYSQGYQNAEQLALSQQQAQAQGAYSLGNIGAGAQNAGISGAGAQLGAGQLQQQYGPNSQAYYNALYGQQLGQFQLPFQESQLLTGAAGSLGSQMGGTSTTQAPPPNIWSQIAGLGIGGLGLAGGLGWKPFGQNRGGAVKGYDAGGAIPFANQSNMIQLASLPPAHGGMGMPAFPKAVDPNAPFNSIGQQGLQLANMASRSMHPQAKPSISPGTIGGTGANIQDPNNPGTGNGLYSQGGTISTGGAVDEPPRDPNGIYVPRGFADGGDTFDQRFGTWPQPEPPADVNFDEKETQQLGLGKPVDWGVGQDASPALPPATNVAPANGYNSDDAALPPNSTPTAGPAIPGLVPPTTDLAPASPSAPQSGAFGIPGLSNDVPMALAMAGFGIAGGASPYAGINIGRGAQQGLESFQQQQKQRLTFEQEAKKLAQQADQFQKSLAQQKELHNAITPYQELEIGEKRRSELRAEQQGQVLTDKWGAQHRIAPLDVNDPSKGMRDTYIDPSTGQIQSRVVPPAGAPQANAPASPSQQWQNAGLFEDGSQLPASSQPVADTSGRNEETLKGLPPEVAAAVKGLADYELNPAQIQPRRKELILGTVRMYDPTYDSALYPAIAKKKSEFMAGGPSSPAGQMTAGRTAIMHLGDMLDAVEDLKGAPGFLNGVASSGIPFLSYGAARLHNSALVGTGTPEANALSSVMTLRNHFAEEVTKFYAGSSGSEAERERALANLDAAKSLPELRAAIQSEARAMSDKVNKLQARWQTDIGGGFNSALRKAIPDFPILDQATKDSLAKINAHMAPTYQGSAPQSGGVPAGAVAHLKQNPRLRDQFDAKYGAGASARILGQ